MAANAIYFPCINVPPDPWLLRMLLYWDRLSAIVPLDDHEEHYCANGSDERMHAEQWFGRAYPG